MGTEVKSHEGLRIWESGIKLVIDIYKITSDFPKHETQLYLSGELGYADKALVHEKKEEIILLRKQIYATIRSLQKRT